jgi:two-component system LytT family sensor kinase
MNIPVNRERFKIYMWIGAAYLLLWMFHNFIESPETFFRKIINNAWLISYLVVINYILFEFTLPYIRLTVKRLIISPFLLAGHLLLYSFGLYLWRHIGIQLHIYFEIKVHPTITSGVEYHFPYSVFSVFFFGIVRHLYDYRKLKETTQQLRIEKQEAELNYLKSQTNPHFLFNTLNNIYSLARDKSDLAPESILRLSKILRYMLYETSGAYISIEQEIRIICDYIALEKLRYDDSLHVDFKHEIENINEVLPPLLLMPLVENAFKHGVSETRNRPFINIFLSTGGRQLQLVVKNSTEPFQGDRSVKENIGLSNLRRQLELLYTDFSLAVQQEESVFTATLKINLASHV